MLVEGKKRKFKKWTTDLLSCIHIYKNKETNLCYSDKPLQPQLVQQHTKIMHAALQKQAEFNFLCQ